MQPVMAGDNRVVARTNSHRLPVNGLYALRSSAAVSPPASPAANSKAMVRKLQHIPISQRSLTVHTLTIRGNSSQVVRKIHILNVIPLTGNAHSSPITLTNMYSRNPPLRIATGIKHNQIMRDFKIFMIIGLQHLSTDEFPHYRSRRNGCYLVWRQRDYVIQELQQPYRLCICR